MTPESFYFLFPRAIILISFSHFFWNSPVFLSLNNMLMLLFPIFFSVLSICVLATMKDEGLVLLCVYIPSHVNTPFQPTPPHLTNVIISHLPLDHIIMSMWMLFTVAPSTYTRPTFPFLHNSYFL